MNGAFRIFAALVFCAVFQTWRDAAVGQTQIKVGLVIPKSGFFAAAGLEVARGAQLAAAMVNREGGINGNKLEILESDDNCNSGLALEVTRKLIENDKVSALIGSPCAGSALASAEFAGKADILTIGLAAVATLTNPERPILRVVGRDDRLGRMTADYINANFRSKRVGLATNLPPLLADTPCAAS